MSVTFRQLNRPLLHRLLLDGPARKTDATVHDGLLWVLATRSPKVENRRETIDALLNANEWQRARQVLSAQGVATSEYPALTGQEWLGYGYAPFGTIPDEMSTREQLFNIPFEFVNETWDDEQRSRFACVEFKTLRKGGLTRIDVSTLEDICRSIGVSASVGGRSGLFGGELSTSLSTETQHHWEYMFSRIQLHYHAYRLRLPGRAVLRQWLFPAVRDTLLQAVASDDEKAFHSFLDRYGTHYVNGIIVGAHASIYSAYSKSVYKSIQSMQVDMNAHYGAVKGGAGTKMSEAFERTATQVQTCVLSCGGRVVPTSIEDLAMDAWQANAAACPAWSGFAEGGAPGETGLVPIYYLVDDDLQEKTKKWWDLYLDKHPWFKHDFVTAVSVNGHANAKEAQSRARSGGFSLLPDDRHPVDANLGAGGWFIYVGALSQGLEPWEMGKAMTDLKTVRGRNASPPPGYTKIDFDLNCGCGSKTEYIFLCFECGNHERLPIHSLSLVARDKPLDGQTYPGWEIVQDESGGNSDLNKGAGGKFVYLLMQRS